MQTQKKKLEFPKVPIKFPGRFPEGHVNSVKGWNFSQKELTETAKEGHMLTMDLDMYGEFSCSAKCRHCFEEDLFDERAMQGGLLNDNEVKRVIVEAKSLGLRSVKIIGPGEPLENKSLLDCLDFLVGQGIQPLIFTKCTAIGDDSIAKEVHGLGPESLARKLREEYGVSINLGSNSFDPETQSKIVRLEEYPAIRNRAIERLVDAGFTEFVPGQPTQLALIFNPITRGNVDEVFEVYTWARMRHIYVISSPTMVAGRCRREYRDMTPDEGDLLDLYAKINLWAIEHGITTLGELEQEGIAPYAGARPCQQVGAGLFIKRNGLALRCPGDDVSIQGRVREKSLAEIWRESDNLNRYGGMINVGCPPKYGKSIPEGFFEKVLGEIKRQLLHQ